MRAGATLTQLRTAVFIAAIAVPSSLAAQPIGPNAGPLPAQPAPPDQAAPPNQPASPSQPAPDQSAQQPPAAPAAPAKAGSSKPASPKASSKEDPVEPARGVGPPVSHPSPAVRTDLQPGDKRPPQSYEGRPHKSSPVEGLLWVPRIVFFPAYVVSEFVLRKPLGLLTVAVEENDVIAKVTDAFTFGPTNNVGLVPTAFIDFGFRPSVGIYHFYDDFLFPKNNLRASIATGGSRYLKASVADRVPLRVNAAGEVKTYLQLEIDGFARPDLKFWGIGPSTLANDVGRYEMRSVGGGARVHADFWKGSFLETWANARNASFADAECIRVRSIDVVPSTLSCKATTILEQVRAGRYALPPGFAGYAAIKLGGRLVLDSRAPRPKSGSGVAVDVRVEHGTVLSGAQHGSWISYGASLGGFVDLTGTRRVLGLIVDARFQDKLQDHFAIPFTELIGAKRLDYVPEDDLLRGFLPGRLLGTSSLTAALDYEWPIWAFLDGTMQAAVGNVFGDHLQDFKLEKTRFSFVGGITSPNHRDHQFNLLVGFGTKTFEQGGGPESLRFLLGGTTGF